MESSFLGLSYLDKSTGEAVFIAETKDSTGQLLPAGNEAVYPDALSGISADVLYVNSVCGLEQFIVIRSQLPAPSVWNIDAANCVLQAISDFGTNPPTPLVTQSQYEDDIDEYLDFGVMCMGHGTAFALGSETNRIPVSKSWRLSDEGHWCLIEQVSFTAVQPFLQELPPPPTASLSGGSHRVLTARFSVPVHRGAGHEATAFKVAKTPLSQTGFALDYSLLSSGGTLTLQGDTTYYVSGTVNVTNLIIEGGAVVKFTNTPAATIVAGNITCKTGPYRMAVFTSKDDESVGDHISGGTGVPTNCTVVTYLLRSGTTNTDQYSYLRFAFATTAISAPPATGGIWHCQFISCDTGFYFADDGTMGLHNVLFHDCRTCVMANGNGSYGEHLTVDRCGFVGSSLDTGWITNSVFTAVTNFDGFSLYNSVTNSSSVGFYQPVGAGNYYLDPDSPYRNAGTTNISTNLLADLQNLTTYPPVVYAQTIISAGMSLSPQAQRDQDAPDLGYHYPPIDYGMGFAWMTNSTLTIGPGTVIATFGTNNQTYGLGITLGASVFCQGSPTALVHWVAYDTVQEEPVSGWKQPWYAMITDSFGYTAPVAFNCRFTDFSTLGQNLFHLYLVGTPASFQDCLFHGGVIDGENRSINFTNCLLERVQCALLPADSSQPVIRNNLFYGGGFEFDPGNPTNSVVKDNLFDQTQIYSGFGGLTYIGGFNASVTNFDHLVPSSATDFVLLSSPSYQVGPLGSYYRLSSSSLFNSDTNTTADQVGLYHYTTITNVIAGLELKETNSLLDCGFHYVAVNTNGVPIDTNGDGVPDYLSDANGNGLVDSGEIGWNINGDLGLKVLITRPKMNSNIP